MKNLTLTRQIISVTILLLFLTSLVTSLPALWLLHRELNRQVELRLTTGEQYTRAIWQLTEFQIQQTLELASRRPTLQQLIEARNWQELNRYLATFQADTVLDFLYVVDSQRTILAGNVPSDDGSNAQLSANPSSFALDHPLPDGMTITGGIRLDPAFLGNLTARTGFIYRLPDATHDNGEADGYLSRPVAPGDTISMTMFIDVSDVQRTQTSAFVSVLMIALITAGAGSLLGGIYLRRRIRPLWRLRDAARVLGSGDLQTPIQIEAFSPEVRTLSQTLETSRQRINSMLQQIQQQRDWSNALMQSIVEGILTVNRQRDIVFYSDSTRQMLNWQDDQTGKSLDEVFTVPDGGGPSFAALLPPEGGHRLITIELNGGLAATLAVTRARTLPDGEITLVLRDVTEESRQSNAQAYYLAHMSHEFRTPLTGLKASLELLIEHDRSLVREERRQLTNSLLMSVASLQHLIDNLLEGSKLQAQKFTLHMQPIRLEEMLVDALNTMQPLLNRRRQPVMLTLPLDRITFRADRPRLVQVLVNLLANAGKYSPEGSEIDIIARFQKQGLWVAVADHGRGVPEQQREVIFQQFVRLDSGAESDHGTGLGLAVVRGIIEAHGGKVGVDAREGGGSLFWFAIPAPPVTAEAPGE